jgi:hypothetical protein
MTGFEPSVRWRWALVAAGALLAFFGWWLAIESARDESLVARAAPVVLSAPVEVSPFAPEPFAASTGPFSNAARGADEVHLCGDLWVRQQAQGMTDGAAFDRAAKITQTRASVLAAMRASGNGLQRATALLLNGAIDNRDELARIASTTTDPKVYALAFKFCGGANLLEGACRLLSAEQWARLDPGNASPWLFAFAAARARNDRAAQDEALHRVATAERNQLALSAASSALLEALPRDPNLTFAGWVMLTELVGMEAALPIGYYPAVRAACSADAVRNANRLQTCGAIAEVIAERSDALLDRQFGVRIGKAIGWPDGRVERMSGEYEAYSASSRPAVGDLNELDCTTMQRDIGFVRSRSAAGGETGAMREWVARSGKLPEDFAADERTREQERALRRREQAASAAASAASGP